MHRVVSHSITVGALTGWWRRGREYIAIVKRSEIIARVFLKDYLEYFRIKGEKKFESMEHFAPGIDIYIKFDRVAQE